MTVALILLIEVYSRNFISTIFLLTQNYLTVYAMIGIVLISLFLIVFTGSRRMSSFGNYWLVFVIWVLFEYWIGKTGQEAANIFRMTFCPFTFLALSAVTRKDPAFTKPIIIMFLLIFLDNSYSFFRYGFLFKIASDVQTNYIFWPFCVAPFIFLIEKKYIKLALLVLLVVMSIVSMKRSVIIVLLLMIPFVMNIKKLNVNKFILNAILVIIIGYFISTLLSDYIGILDERLGSMSEDEGSGRIPIFNRVWEKITTLDFIDLIIGRGFGSISETGYSNAHNDILQTIYEYGLIGLALYVVLFVKIFRICRSKALRDSKFKYGYYMSVIIFIVMGMVSNLTVSYTFFVYLCAYWGIADGYLSSQKKIVQTGNSLQYA